MQNGIFTMIMHEKFSCIYSNKPPIPIVVKCLDKHYRRSSHWFWNISKSAFRRCLYEFLGKHIISTFRVHAFSWKLSIWYMHDGAPTHFVHNMKEHLNTVKKWTWFSYMASSIFWFKSFEFFYWDIWKVEHIRQ